MSGKTRIAVIGAGKMGSVHAANVARSSEARLVAVAGGSGAQALAAAHQVEALSVEDACARPDIDAVVIASPNRFHADHIQLAAAGGKATLVEKPVDLSLDRVQECIDAVGSASERIVVAFNRRFDPSFVRVRQQIMAGLIGPVQQLVIVSRDPAPPPLDYIPTSGGLFRDMTIHDFDMARFLVGEIASVSATVQCPDPEIATTGDASGAIVTMTATSGALVTIVNARSNATGYDQRLEAYGPRGTIAVDNPGVTLVRTSTRGAVDARDQLQSFYADRYEHAYRAEIEHLIAVAQGRDEPRASLRDGQKALELAIAAAGSVQAGTVVRCASSAT